MSEFSKEMVQRVAHLARLSFSEEELGTFSRQLSDIVGYVEKLNELDTEGIEPLSSPHDITAPPREDTVIPGLPVADLLANAPSARSDHFIIPKVL